MSPTYLKTMTKINILGIDYLVVFDDDNEAIKDNLGCVDLDHQIIYIRNSINDQMKVSTLLHEVIEAINFQLELNMPHRVICGIEVGINQVVTENSINLFYDVINEEELEEI